MHSRAHGLLLNKIAHETAEQNSTCDMGSACIGQCPLHSNEVCVTVSKTSMHAPIALCIMNEKGKSTSWKLTDVPVHHDKAK